MSRGKDLLATVSERLFPFLLSDEKMKLYRKPEAFLSSEFHSKTFCDKENHALWVTVSTEYRGRRVNILIFYLNRLL